MRTPVTPRHRARLSTAALALILGACNAAPGSPTGTAGSAGTIAPTIGPAASPPRPTPNIPPVQDIVEAGATAFTIGPAPDFTVVADGFAFVNAAGGGIGHIAKLNAKGKIVGDYDIPGGSCGALDVGFGSVWTATCPGPGLARIDIETGEITTIATGIAGDSETNVAAGEGAAWIVVGGFPRKLVKVDPETNTVADEFSLEGAPNGVRADFGSVWVADPVANVIHRLDPADGHLIADIAVGAKPQFFDAGEGGVWTLNQADGTVSRIDPGTNTVVATIAVGEPIQGGEIAVGGGFVWARGGSSLLWKIDPATNSVVAFYGPPLGSGGVAADDEAVWVTAHDPQIVWRLPLP